MPELNGQVKPAVPDDKQRLEDILIGQPLSTGYRPTVPMWTLWTVDVVPQFYLLRDIELMMIHPIVLNGLNYFKSGIAGAEFEVECESPEVAMFVEEQSRRYWDKGVPKLQGGYEYGWIGCEALYKADGEVMYWDGFDQFSPRDVYLLTQNRIPVGVRVKQIQPIWGNEKAEKGTGYVDLWMGTADVPAKGIWYPHNPRYSSYYGQSQLLGAWKPWRRLAWKDAAESVVDGGVYRFAYAGPMVGYPEEDFQGATGSPATTADSMGNPRKYARDVARQMGEYAKAGAVIGLPSTKYPPELGGGEKWTFTWPTTTFNVDPLINYIKYLHDCIFQGIGVPPELIQAAETGSGYSGRSIPLEGFLLGQQHIADNLLALFVHQILHPLVRWNFGEIKFQVKVKNLLETKRMAQMGQDANAAGGVDPNGMPGERKDQVPTSHDPLARDTGGTPQAPASNNAMFSMDRIEQIARKILGRAA